MLPLPSLVGLNHPEGERSPGGSPGHSDTFAVDTPGGVFHVRFESDAEVSHLGGVVPFAQFLHASGLFASWVAESPLKYSGHRALGALDCLGSLVLSMINGNHRFAHIAALRGDSVTPKLLGMSQVVSEDTVRRAMLRLVQDAGAQQESMSWLRQHCRKGLEPLLGVPWTLDIDVTVKPVFGFQPGSVVGYNPTKPGRPSHALHSFVMAQTRLVLDVAVRPGNEHTSAHTLPELRRLIESMPREHWPSLLRGDCAFGTDDIMSWAEETGLHYLFKQKMTSNTKKLVRQLDLQSDWKSVGEGWEGKESTLQLSTWDAPRRAIVFRRPSPGPRYLRAADVAKKAQKPQQTIIDECRQCLVDNDYEYYVLITNLDEDIKTIFQRYRDRGDIENVFDEIKNHWGWGGFTSRNFAVTQAVAVIAAMAYNWWSLFTRLADPEHHREAITTRPTLLHGIIRKTTHANQSILTITSTNEKKSAIARFFTRLTQWIGALTKNAEQSTPDDRWKAILSTIFTGPLGKVSPSTS